MTFHINPFHYTKPEIFNKSSGHTFFDIENIYFQKKIAYPDHEIIIVSNDELYSKNNNIGDNINYLVDQQKVYIDIIKNIEKPLCLINILSNHQVLEITIAKDVTATIIHEDYISQSGSVNLNINNYGILNYYNLVRSYSSNFLHKKIDSNNYHILNMFFIQNKNTLLYKLDCKIKLHHNAQCDLQLLNHLQEKQLKDDCFEIEQIGENTKSNIHYLSLNNGKAVSQINNIIDKNAINSSLEQHIKHILLSESGASFSKPSLMIHCPTVASHGNTISSFPEEWLLYLYQKGIHPEKAYHIIENSMLESICSVTPYASQFLQFLGERND